MRPELRRVGNGAHPLLILDECTGDLSRIVAVAAALAPFPESARTYYPGVRRVIGGADADADAYVERLLQAAAPYIGGAFGVDAFTLLEASFSIVTRRPEQLGVAQRAPHFDSTDPGYLAVLHYLGGTDGSGTAFYRQRTTGIERVSAANMNAFVATARRESVHLAGYTSGSNAYFEQIAAVEAVPDRLIVYPGSLLHSGLIPPAMSFSPDPRLGRLTANIFIKGH